MPARFIEKKMNVQFRNVAKLSVTTEYISRARLVLSWVTRWESLLTLATFFFRHRNCFALTGTQSASRPYPLSSRSTVQLYLCCAPANPRVYNVFSPCCTRAKPHSMQQKIGQNGTKSSLFTVIVLFSISTATRRRSGNRSTAMDCGLGLPASQA